MSHYTKYGGYIREASQIGQTFIPYVKNSFKTQHGRIPIDPAILAAIGHRFIVKKKIINTNSDARRNRTLFLASCMTASGQRPTIQKRRNVKGKSLFRSKEVGCMVSNKWGSGALLEKWVQGMQPQHTGQFFRNNLNETKIYQAFKMYRPCFSVY